MIRPYWLGNAGLTIVMVLTGIGPARGGEPAPDGRVAHLVEAEDLVEAGEARHDFHMLVRAACVRAEAGDVASIDAERAPDKILSDDEDDLSIDRLLARAMSLAPPAERSALKAARDEEATGRSPGPALCGTQDGSLRGTGYVVRLIDHIAQRRTLPVDLPRLKPDEPIVITVRADSFGLVSVRLFGPAGLACHSAGPASRTASCTAPPPGGGEMASGYRLLLTNDADLVTRISIYVS